jgi:4-hydroxy-3-methylbut-2-enyl diphosphate reductase IspH
VVWIMGDVVHTRYVVIEFQRDSRHSFIVWGLERYDFKHEHDPIVLLRAHSASQENSLLCPKSWA